jgi:transketolase
MDSLRLRAMASAMRRWIIDQSFASGVGHIGSALSVVDVTAALWGAVLRGAGTHDPDRDRFILAKGHAALALYAALRWNGLMDEATFRTYCRDGSAVGVHPEHTLPGVDVSTGSLGQGLSIGCGLAYGLRLKDSPGRVFVLLSDAECNEGQVWEAAMFAAHHGLSNLTAVVDVNGCQALGQTRQVLDLEPLAERWRAFGWDAFDIDGHDPEALAAALSAPPGGRPRLAAARTRLGKGISFMEGRVEWHYRNLSETQHAQSLAELEAQG